MWLLVSCSCRCCLATSPTQRDLDIIIWFVQIKNCIVGNGTTQAVFSLYRGGEVVMVDIWRSLMHSL